jgi:arabinose-5-phosphate isomerase
VKTGVEMSHYEEAQRIFADEIHALQCVAVALQVNFDDAVELCLKCQGKLVLVGIGKSGIIAHKIAATLVSTGTSAVFLNAGEALHGDMGVISENDVVIMLSNSASTLELARMLPSIRKIGAKLIGLFGSAETSLAKQMDVLLNAAIEREACPLNLAPMTSSTVALVVGDALAAALMKAREFTTEDFAVYHPGGSLGRRLLYRVSDVMQFRELVPVVAPADSFDTAIQALGAGCLGAVMVCDTSDTLLGIIVEADVRRHYLRRTSPDTLVSEVMITEPKVIASDALLGDALALMETKGQKVYVLPVVDVKSRLLGLLRMHDVVSI